MVLADDHLDRADDDDAGAWIRLSQEVLAGRVGRTADWLNKIENGHIDLDRLSVLRLIADTIDVTLADLIAEPSLMEWTEDSGERTVPALRSVLMDYREITGTSRTASNADPISLDTLKAQVNDLWLAYQATRFGYVANRLTDLIPSAKVTVPTLSGDDARIASGRLALAYHLAATLLTKLGEADLAWTASNRGMEAARRSESPVVIGSLLRSLSHSLLSTGEYAEAVRLTHEVVAYLEPHMVGAGEDPDLGPRHRPARRVDGCGPSRDRDTVREFLDGADAAAQRLGGNANLLWTAFGPTNVAIHRVATAMELGDLQVALAIGPDLDTSPVPVERQVRHSLEVARALSGVSRREDALTTVLAAEQKAPEQVRYHYLSRHLVQTWIRTQRGKPSHQLAGLAARLDII